MESLDEMESVDGQRIIPGDLSHVSDRMSIVEEEAKSIGQGSGLLRGLGVSSKAPFSPTCDHAT